MKSLLDPEVSAGVHELRGALADLIGGVGADVRRPQEVSRQLLLDKSLAWKLSRIVAAGDPHDAIQHMPGEAAFAILIKAVRAAGGADALRRRAEGAIRNYQAAVLRHVGDRKTLEIIVDGLPNDRAGERLLASRKLAFRGNSGIWGVQARARINTVLIAPNPYWPDMMDAAHVGGWVDFRRIRSDARWVLFRRQPYNSDGSRPVDAPLDPGAADLILREFCTGTVPAIHTTAEGPASVDELGESAVGNGGLFTCFFGSVTRALGSRFGDFPGDVAQFPANISAPVEHLQFDMIVHRDCRFAAEQQVATYGTIGSVWPTPLNDRDRLPIDVGRADLGSGPPVVSSTAFPRYRELIDHVFDRMGWDAKQFVGTRHTVDFPAFPSMVVVACPLDEPQYGH